MAELYLARSVGPEGFAKLVVLKKILPDLAKNGRFVRLFLEEAKLAASLDHPHIAHVYDMGTVDGNYFFTMEYVHGQDVRTMMKRTAGQPFPIEHAVMIGVTVAAALHYAHEQCGPDGAFLGIVHRDVSPSNILVSYDGTVKLVDFGVAKTAASTVKTRTGAIKGKIAYMSPEQASGHPIDRRSDIFSLGIALWELVAGRPLYRDENDLLTIQRIVNSEPPSPREHRPECPPELEKIIMRALSKRANDRYQTAESMQLALEDLAREAKLPQSSVGLRSFMRKLFVPELEAWEAAQQSGIGLAEHVVRHPELTTHFHDSDEAYSFDDDDVQTYHSEPEVPATIRADVTPMPVMQYAQQYPLPTPTPVSMDAYVPHTQSGTSVRRRAFVVGGVAVAAIVVSVGLVVSMTRRDRAKASSDPIQMNETAPVAAPPPPAAPVAAPSVPAPAPTVPATVPPPTETPVVVAPPTRPATRPRKKTPPAAKPPSETPVTPPKPVVQPVKKFDPNDPLPPKR